ncbi:MAG TPA: serine/threonine-protein kinase [Myxococcota bacterium]|nr:serine/threonine-protein kinase [Myxococcota bacterium]
MAEPILKLDKFMLIESVGQGGMATVYKARIVGPMGFEKMAAVKLLHAELGSDPEVVRMFIDEARIGGQLSHPNVVNILDFGQIDSRYFIAMEYVDGCALSQLIRPGRSRKAMPLPIEAAACAIADLLEALEYVHDATDSNGIPLGIVHRDISPQNIIVTRKGTSKVGDFGIAKGDYRETFTKAGVVKGKLAYMSPEQAAGKSQDRRSDIASTGLTLFALITGQPAFTGTDTTKMLAQAEKGLQPEALDRIKCPPELKAVILKATALRPQDRYQKANEFRKALVEAVPGYDTIGREILKTLVAKISPDPKAEVKPTQKARKAARDRWREISSATITGEKGISKATIYAYRVATGLALSAILVAIILVMTGIRPGAN